MTIFSIFAALLCLALLIFWHELGHFVAARACGVFVERFSVGFGKPLLRWTDKKGTEFCLAALPLGGYVRMHGEDTPGQGNPSPLQAEVKGFDQASLGQKLLIIFAGPFANILLTWLVLSFLNLQGTTQLRAFIDTPINTSLAAYADLQRGDLITSVGGNKVQSWKDIELALVSYIGENGDIALTIARGDESFTKRLSIQDWLSDVYQPQPSRALGLLPWQPATPPRIAEVVQGSAAATAGIEVGDLILSVNDRPINEWGAFVELVQSHPGQLLRLTVERENTRQFLELIPHTRSSPQDQDVQYGYAGVSVQPVSWPEEKLLLQEFGLLEAFGKGYGDALDMVVLIGVSIAKLVSGEIAFSNLSGPVGIVKVAGESAQSGFVSLLAFVAYMSMSLGLLNLLPLPVLDGGQALLVLGEGVSGKQMGDIWRTILMRISIAMLLVLMLTVTFNDLVRL